MSTMDDDLRWPEQQERVQRDDKGVRLCRVVRKNSWDLQVLACNRA